MVNLNIDLPESFFQEEERDGFLVSAKTKELWAVQLDLLNEFDRVCKKHNLKYILDFGTLLGAVRHKGFIPWDDDIDVSMLREDYEELIRIAPHEFKEPYFLQSYHSDHRYCDSVTKLRRSDTTFLLTRDLGCKGMNNGIFMDVFVYDSFSSPDLNLLRQSVQFAIKKHVRMSGMAQVPSLADGAKAFLRYFYYNIRYGYKSIYKLNEELDHFAMQFNDGRYKACVTSHLERFYPYNWFDEIIHMQFEHLMMPVSVYYDEMLKLLFGDYMTPVMGTSAHTLLYFDASRSYRDVIKDKELMKELKRKRCQIYSSR